MAKMQLILGLTILFIAVEVAISSPTGVLDHCMYCACHMLDVYNYITALNFALSQSIKIASQLLNSLKRGMPTVWLKPLYLNKDYFTAGQRKSKAVCHSHLVCK